MNVSTRGEGVKCKNCKREIERCELTWFHSATGAIECSHLTAEPAEVD